MLYKGNDKIGKVYLGDTAIGKIYFGNELVYQKEKPAPKRVKSITVAVPAWGSTERVWLESISRAVKDTSSGYYLDVTIGGVGFRLLGGGGNRRATLSRGTITLPDNVVISESDVSEGQGLTFSSKMPSITTPATYKYSNDSYTKYAYYEFAGAPFIPNSKIKTRVAAKRIASELTLKTKLHGGTWTETTGIKDGAFVTSSMPFTERVYTEEDFVTLSSAGMSYWKELKLTFQIEATNEMRIDSVPTLVTPEASHKFTLKVTKIETF